MHVLTGRGTLEQRNFVFNLEGDQPMFAVLITAEDLQDSSGFSVHSYMVVMLL